MTVLLNATRAAASSDIVPVVLADAGVENVNAQVDQLIHTGVLRRLPWARIKSATTDRPACRLDRADVTTGPA